MILCSTQVRLYRLVLAMFVSYGFSALPVLAAQILPGSANPNRIEQRFRPQHVPKAKPEIIIPNIAASALSTETLKIKFTLQAVILDGSTIYKQADLAPFTANLIGKKISLSQLLNLSDILTAKYRRDGYILSQVIVPPQKVTGGIVHMRAVEGYVSSVSVQGNAHDSRGLIASMAAHIKTALPLTAKVLERYVLLIQDIPGISVRTVLRPAGKLSGAAALDILVTHKTVTGYVQVDDRGSRAIGPLQGLAGINLNSPFGRDTMTGLQFATVNPPEELQYIALQHNEIITSEGMRLKLSGNYSHSKPSGALSDLDPLGNSLTLHVSLDYPLVRLQARTLWVGLGFTATNNSVDLLDSQFSDDKLRYLSLTANYDLADTLFGDSRPASTLINCKFSQGLNILGATRTGSPDLSVANGHSDFTRFYIDLTRNQSISGRFGLGFAAAGQIAAKPLLSSMRFGLGGSRFGRGYEPSELTGDNGLACSVEARYSLPTWRTLFINPQFYIFYDIGNVWNISPAAGQSHSQSLASAGPGLRFNLPHNLSVDLELAKPLTRDIASRGNRNVRLLFSVISRF